MDSFDLKKKNGVTYLKQSVDIICRDEQRPGNGMKMQNRMEHYFSDHFGIAVGVKVI